MDMSPSLGDGVGGDGGRVEAAVKMEALSPGEEIRAGHVAGVKMEVSPPDEEINVEGEANRAEGDPANIGSADDKAGAGGGGGDEDNAPPKRPDAQLCVVCENEVGKYKCPQCRMPFCSVACNRVHKESHPLSATAPSEAEGKQKLQTQPEPPAAAQRNNDPYSVLLDHRAEFARLLQRYPFLQNELAKIQQITLPPENNDGAGGGNSGFPFPLKQQQQFGGGKKQPMWSREVGLRRGAAALRKARTDPGDRGDAIREFCYLVLNLLSAPPKDAGQAGSGGVERKDVTSLVREEVAAEETKIIERLLQEEAGDGDK